MNGIERMERFSMNLLKWYRKHRRDLPWRRSRDPYHIWVSEVMLQQTRVDTVIPYYHRFIERFPTIEALAEAPEEEVLKAWEGLGYYSRARNLQAAVREVQSQYGGQVPDTKEEISTLKGVGPYTAGAVLSIAYNVPEPAVDGNVMRVLSRFFLLRDDIAKGSTRVRMEHIARELIPPGAAGDFNQALMELGATVCTPKSPQCLICPVMEQCSGRMEGVELELPVKTKAKPPRPEYRLAAIVEGSGRKQGQIAVRQRPATGLLARMWELPHIETPNRGTVSHLPDSACLDMLRAALLADGIDARPQGAIMNAEHTFSHIHWNVRVFLFRAAEQEASCAPVEGAAGEAAAALQEREADSADGGWLARESGLTLELTLDQTEDQPQYRWIGPDDLESLAFPNMFLRVLKDYWAEPPERSDS